MKSAASCVVLQLAHGKLTYAQAGCVIQVSFMDVAC